MTLSAVSAFELGFAPTAAAILSLGPQNILLLRPGLSGRKALIVIGICYGCDLGLVLFGALGLGAILAAFPMGPVLLRATGAGYLALMSARCFRRAVGEDHVVRDRQRSCARRVIHAALMVSLLNPLAWVESVLVIGAVSSTVPADLKIVLVTGASLGTLFRLSVLRIGARTLQLMFRWLLFGELLTLWRA